MIINKVNFDHGVQQGKARAQSHYPAAVFSLDSDSRARIENVLNLWPQDLHDRFVELFVEMSVLASMVRSYNNESALTEDELQAFLAHSALFFNSFKHR